MTTDVRPLPVEVVTPVKASEAMRLGCLIAPEQAMGTTVSDDGLAACAFGAMYYGLGYKPSINQYGHLDFSDEVSKNIGIEQAMMETMTHCPACASGRSQDVVDVVVHLNDEHEWPREAIADWLEGVGY